MSRYDKLHSLVSNFLNKTGLSMLETDGPYGKTNENTPSCSMLPATIFHPIRPKLP